MSASNKLVIIGIDGGTFNILNPLMEQGLMNNLRNLVQCGSSGILISTQPSITPVAWTSMLTGKTPGNHGIYDWGARDKNYRPNIINWNDVDDKSVFQILSEHGKRVGILNVPMTYPPDSCTTFTVSGVLTPSLSSKFTHPDTLFEKIKKAVGDYILDVHHSQVSVEGIESYLDEIIRMTELRTKTALYLISHFDLDVFMVVFVGPDRVQHNLWNYLGFSEFNHNPYRAKIEQFYRKIDEGIGQIVSQSGDDATVLVISDHGFGPGDKVIFLNNWLIDNGYLFRRKRGGFKRKTIELARQIGITRERLKAVLIGNWIQNKITPILNETSAYVLTFDWSRSLAFANSLAGIFINMQGREPQGIVKQGKQYEMLRAEIIEKLSNLRDPITGGRVFEGVYRREEIYSGARVDKAPDIVPVIADEKYRLRPGLIDGAHERINNSVFARAIGTDSGTHRREGILIARGQQIKPGYKLQGQANIWEIAPTLLYLCSVPIPEDMENSGIFEIIKDEYLSAHPITFANPLKTKADINRGRSFYSPEDEELVEKRLKDLGYL